MKSTNPQCQVAFAVALLPLSASLAASAGAASHGLKKDHKSQHLGKPPLGTTKIGGFIPKFIGFIGFIPNDLGVPAIRKPPYISSVHC